jgi:hypothetical protein
MSDEQFEHVASKPSLRSLTAIKSAVVSDVTTDPTWQPY